jgi:hypothetical protein
MAKKKTQSKKHKFKHVTTHDGLTSANSELDRNVSSSSETKVVRRETKRPAVVFASSARDFSYVAVDLRRVAIFAVALIALELVLWFVFGHTGVGPSVYKLVNV